MFFTHKNNIGGLLVRNVSSNGSVNMGNGILKGFAGNSQAVGGQTVIGDAFNSPTPSFGLNVVNDPDLIDQPQAQV